MSREVRIRELNRFREKLGVPTVFGGVLGANGRFEFDAVGVRRRGDPEAVLSSDRVHIGSCFKMITAGLFGTFVSEQRAQWEMPVIDLFPDLADSIANAWRQTSVADLFYCLGGMAANPPRSLLSAGYRDSRSLADQRTALTRLAFSALPKNPGRFLYSNMSYIVMGAAIDRLSGASFESALEARLLKPLGINSAGYGPPPEVWGHLPRLCVGNRAFFKGKPVDPADSKNDNPPVLSSAGTLHLGCADWAKLLQLFLVGGKTQVIESAVIERILQMPQNPAAQMAMGWAPVGLDGLSFIVQGSNVRWAATALMDDVRRHTALVVCNDGRSSVLRQSVPLAHRLLGL